ncbi:hypothetical protein SH412_003253 [Planctellipticum variicoloris]|nr:hypothetical protein SH412_003253 [Planctomycetaceae bacterium SH412]
MSRVVVFDSTGRQKIWADAVELEPGNADRMTFWSPFEPANNPGTTRHYFNNQMGIRSGDVLVLRDDEGGIQQVEVVAPPRSELGNNGRTFFEVRSV